jgi:hypothetical protein
LRKEAIVDPIFAANVSRADPVPTIATGGSRARTRHHADIRGGALDRRLPLVITLSPRLRLKYRMVHAIQFALFIALMLTSGAALTADARATIGGEGCQSSFRSRLLENANSRLCFALKLSLCRFHILHYQSVVGISIFSVSYSAMTVGTDSCDI